MAESTVKIIFLGDASKLKSELGGVDSASSKAEGGFGKLAKAIGGVAAVAGAGAFLAGGVKSLMEIEKLSAQTDAVLKSTGNAAGVTRDEIEAYADAIEKKTGIEAEKVQAGQNLLLTFTNVKNGVGEGNDVFNQATDIMADMATAMGTDVKSGAMQLGKALNDPVAGIAALTRVGVQFTDEQKTMIKEMVAAGDVMGAQKVILGELETQFGGSAAAAGDTFAGKIAKLKNNFGEMQESIAQRLMPAALALTDWFLNEGIPALERFAGWINDNVVPVLQDFAGFVRDEVLPVLVDIGTWVTEHAIAAFQAFSEFAQEELLPRLQRLGDWIRDELLPRLAELGQWIMDNVVPALQALGTFIVENVLPVLAQIAAFIVDRVLPVLADLALFIIDRVIPVLGDIAEFIIEKVIPAIAKIVEWVTDKLVPVFSSIYDVVTEKIVPAVKTIVDKFGEIITKVQEVYDGVKQKFDEVVEFVTGIPGRITDAIGDVTRTLVSKGLDLILGLGTGIRNAWDGLVMWVQGIPSMVLEAIGDAAMWLYDVGRDAIQGLWEGMRAAWVGVAGWLSGKGGELEKIVRDRTETRSPSRAMQRVGYDVMGGLSLGLAQGYAPIPRWLESIGDDMVGRASDMADAMTWAVEDMGTSMVGSMSSTMDGLVGVVANGAQRVVEAWVPAMVAIDEINRSIDAADWNAEGLSPEDVLDRANEARRAATNTASAAIVNNTTINVSGVRDPYVAAELVDDNMLRTQANQRLRVALAGA